MRTYVEHSQVAARRLEFNTHQQLEFCQASSRVFTTRRLKTRSRQSVCLTQKRASSYATLYLSGTYRIIHTEPGFYILEYINLFWPVY